MEKMPLDYEEREERDYWLDQLLDYREENDNE
jgi:hypothetical protein